MSEKITEMEIYLNPVDVDCYDLCDEHREYIKKEIKELISCLMIKLEALEEQNRISFNFYGGLTVYVDVYSDGGTINTIANLENELENSIYDLIEECEDAEEDGKILHLDD